MESHVNELVIARGELVQTVIARMNPILADRFGCRVLYKTLPQLRSESLEIAEQMLALKGPGPHEMDDNLILPVQGHHDLVGFVILMDWAKVESQSRELALDLIDCTVLEIITLIDNLHWLTNIENLSPLKRVVSIEKAMPQSILVQSSHHWVRRPILLRGDNPVMNQRMAFEIHEALNNHAFLPLQDLPPVEDWQELGAVTIFIEDVTSLTLKQIEGLRQLSLNSQIAMSPQVIGCGLNHAAKELETLRGVFPSVIRCPSERLSAKELRELVHTFMKARSARAIPSRGRTLTH